MTWGSFVKGRSVGNVTLERNPTRMKADFEYDKLGLGLGLGFRSVGHQKQTLNVTYLESFPAGCRVGTTILSADMLVSGGAGPSVAPAVRVDLVIGA